MTLSRALSNPLTHVCGAALVAAAIGEPALAAPPLKYRLTELPGLSTDPGTPFLPTAWAYGVSDSGVVLGNSYLPADDRFHPMRWDAVVGTVLPTLPGATGVNAGATSINGAGVIVGLSPYPGAGFLDPHAAAWVNGTPVDLGALPGHVYSFAWDVNAAGVIVGQSGEFAFNPNFITKAVRWVGGAIETLASPADLMYVDAVSINDAGVAVGSGINLDTKFFAVIWEGAALKWEPDGTMTELPRRSGDTLSRAFDITNNGRIVGDSGRLEPFVVAPGEPPFDFYVPHAVRWGPGEIQTLVELPGDSASTAVAQNASGLVIGGSGNFDFNITLEPVFRPVVWVQGQPREFNALIETPGWTAERLNGRWVAFVATPVHGN